MSPNSRNTIDGLFGHAAALNPKSSLHDAERSSSDDVTTDRYLRRVPVPQRGQADYIGETMARYVNGLEARLVDHIRQYAPYWQAQETRRVLKDWSKPGLHHPAPSWASPRDVLAEARDYAATRLRNRVAAKLNRLNDIRVSRQLDRLVPADPLKQVFHNQSTAAPKLRRNI